MNGIAHTHIFRSAIDALDVPWRERLSVLPPDLLDRAANYPDLFDNPACPESDKDRIDPDWKAYGLLPDTLNGAVILHGWPVADPLRHGVNAVLLAYYLQQGMKAVQDDDLERWAKFMGCLSHFFGDMTQAAHVVDTRLMEELLPRPDGFATFDYHTTVAKVNARPGCRGSTHGRGHAGGCRDRSYDARAWIPVGERG